MILQCGCFYSLLLLFKNISFSFLVSVFLFFCFIETPTKVMKNVFYFMLKPIFVLKIFNFLSLFSHVRKQLDKKTKNNFKVYDIADWTANYNTHIAQYPKQQFCKSVKAKQWIWSVTRMQHEKYFSWKIIHKMWWRS